jgi:hypothetical protein
VTNPFSVSSQARYWLHSIEASHEDNTHKELVQIDIVMGSGMKRQINELHRARVYTTGSPAFASSLSARLLSRISKKKIHEKIALRLVQARLRARKAAGPSSEILSSILSHSQCVVCRRRTFNMPSLAAITEERRAGRPAVEGVLRAVDTYISEEAY